MEDYSSAQQQSNNFSQSSAFAAALQRAKQIAAKIHPGPTKRPQEDGPEPEAKKFMSNDYNPSGAGGPGMNSAVQAAAAVAARLSQSAGNMSSEDIRIPDQAVGLVIGRGGEQISRLQNESGCKIQMNNDSGERLCTLTGARDSIGRAKEMIQKIVSQHGSIETVRAGPGGPCPMPGGGYSPPANSGSSGSMGIGGGGGGGYQPYEEIMVPGPKVGLIIGKGGETIKMLQEKTGAKMVIIQDGPGQEMEKPLRITGDPAKVEHAKQMVFDLIGDKGGPFPGGNYNGLCTRSG